MDSSSLRRLIEMALEEDIGTGDVTTLSLVEAERKGIGKIIAKEPMIIAGLFVTAKVFTVLDAGFLIRFSRKEGDSVPAGALVFEAQGRLRALLSGERTALNFLQRLSGIATHTADYVRAVEGKKTKIVDTRKTTPGWRILEKHAVRMGGARNHRMGLYDGILIKDNHIQVCGTIRKAMERIRNGASHLHKIEVEVTDAEQVEETLKAGADVIMLDNMDISQIRESVSLIRGRALVEVSGRIRKQDLPALAELGVDLISIGALTHSAPSVDLSMEIEPLD